ncbi:MAG: MBL fold metallo-hydrolase [Candidatus Aminicenantes bacterium]|nr:MBL fold metallo-hydrolase [Candidatus Aminicenantes bacterium]NIM77615.1 MBL fold metallo-hydrolase [Candidatus Aminicenantes bacterium]NIN16929.1 MBL fold metallo-hydrolase [Candidatus Aminicenantes bacterium]NIN40822.1 MBL fold metallo-hydrolase [Candidatus Aminicenantes bacterium]NIN83626.1 MBL fold metallo-hydrolase [Candidatus Aminicenantes bacterium]
MGERKETKFEPVGNGIYVVETYYLNRTGFACCYVLEDGGEAAVIETNTNYAVPQVLGTLDQLGIPNEQVKYVILTHIHLDHAGGTGELMKNLPAAELVVHPRGRKHMINPEKLIKSVKQVYGSAKYKEMYGDIIPVPKERVKTANDGDTVQVGSRELRMLDTPGHAKHHNIVFDDKTASVFSGDNFGIAYPRLDFGIGASRLVFPSMAPTQFEPEKALETYGKIVDLQPSRVLLTHYGALEDVAGAHAQLQWWIEFSVEIAEKRYNEGYRKDDLTKILQQDVWAQFENVITKARGSGPTREDKQWLALDTELNGMGLSHYIHKLHSKA